MSRQAPHFSASVIGSRWLERSALDGICVGEADICLTSSVGAADPPDSALISPKKDLLSARNVNAATRTIPAPVIQTATGKLCHAPIRMVISAANPLKPGMPIDA